MPFIISFFSWLANFLSGFIVKYFGEKALTFLITVGSIALLFTAFLACLGASISKASSALQPIANNDIVYGMGLFLPSNFELNLSLDISAIACRFAYDLAVSKVLAGNSAK